MGAWIGNPRMAEQSRFTLYDALKVNDFDRIREIFHFPHASIPHDWFRKSGLDRFEGRYAGVPYVSFTALGLDIAPEGVGNQGELGMAVKFNVRVSTASSSRRWKRKTRRSPKAARPGKSKRSVTPTNTARSKSRYA
jgi:hypothetical protein